MSGFLSKKLLYGLLVIAGVVTVVFFLFNILPGDPARMMLGQRADVSSIENINRELGRDKSLGVQFALYVNDLSPLSFHSQSDPTSPWNASVEKYGNYATLIATDHLAVILKVPYLRRSYQTKQLVSEVVADALPGTIILAVAALAFAAIFGIALGVLAALRKNKITDHLVSMLAVLGMAVPSFFAGIIIAWVFGFVLADITGFNMTGSLYSIDPFDGFVLELKNLVLPAFTLGIRPLSVIVQLTRSSMLDVLSQDYIRTAKAKGLSKQVTVFKHALRNALNPVLTAVSGWFGSLLAGAVFIEYIFGWKGIGKVTVDSLERYDFPVVMGAVLVVSIFFVIINIIVDVLYGMLDPRIRI
ncbi:MAG: ABC transporter permease [Bacteroidota bacterium]|nr:ABC transporter permease [Bacteroidota bacterium]